MFTNDGSHGGIRQYWRKSITLSRIRAENQDDIFSLMLVSFLSFYTITMYIIDLFFCLFVNLNYAYLSNRATIEFWKSRREKLAKSA